MSRSTAHRFLNRVPWEPRIVPFVLGTDEAGYGPNLGPLCIAATAWEIPDDLEILRMYHRLKAVIVARPSGEKKLAIGDSKSLYSGGGALRALERGVLAALGTIQELPLSWRDAFRFLDPGALPQIDGEPWHAGYDESLPLETPCESLVALAKRVSSGCARQGIRIASLQATALFPASFNAAVAACGNKAEVLSLTTLRLARRVLESLPPGPATVFCDKHGGRNRYAALLQHVFEGDLVAIGAEGPELSVYRVQLESRPIEFRFQPQGERHLPTALASMTAKYLRELAMRPLNAFWRQHLPDLKPTAGYFTDAHRFLAEINQTRERLAISSNLLWRVR